MRRATPAQLLSNAASTLESLPESLVLFGSPASGNFYGFVRQGHIQTTKHWMHGQRIVPNKLA